MFSLICYPIYSTLTCQRIKLYFHLTVEEKDLLNFIGDKTFSITVTVLRRSPRDSENEEEEVLVGKNRSGNFPLGSRTGLCWGEIGEKLNWGRNGEEEWLKLFTSIFESHLPMPQRTPAKDFILILKIIHIVPYDHHHLYCREGILEIQCVGICVNSPKLHDLQSRELKVDVEYIKFKTCQ